MVIYPRDVMVLTGMCEKSSHKLVKRIKEKFAKEGHQFVTIDEFCRYTGIPSETVEK